MEMMGNHLHNVIYIVLIMDVDFASQLFHNFLVVALADVTNVYIHRENALLQIFSFIIYQILMMTETYRNIPVSTYFSTLKVMKISTATLIDTMFITHCQTCST